jgi:hypothetical protein
MILYFASAHNDDGESLDVFISAPNPAAALEVFNVFNATEQTADGKVTLFEVPHVSIHTQVHEWPHKTSTVFNE